MKHHAPRLVGTLLLGTRMTAAVLVHRHANLVRRRCLPIACDVSTKAALYDLDAVEEEFRTVQRRVA